MDERMTALYVNAQTGRIQRPELMLLLEACGRHAGCGQVGQNGMNRLHWDPPIPGSQHGKPLKAALKSRVPAYPGDPIGELQPGADGGRGWG